MPDFDPPNHYNIKKIIKNWSSNNGLEIYFEFEILGLLNFSQGVKRKLISKITTEGDDHWLKGKGFTSTSIFGEGWIKVKNATFHDMLNKEDIARKVITDRIYHTFEPFTIDRISKVNILVKRYEL